MFGKLPVNIESVGERKAGKSNFTVIRLTWPEKFISLKKGIASKSSARSPGFTTLYPPPPQEVAYLLGQEFPNPVIYGWGWRKYC